MSIELVARAKKTRLKGDSTAKLLLIVLADYANDEGMAWPSVRTLTEEVEKQDRQIQRALRKLEDMGLIRLGDQRLTRNYPKGQRPTVYEILPAKPRRRGRETGDMHDTGTGDMHDTTTSVTEDTTTPVTHDTTPVTHTTPPRCHARRGTGVTHDTQTVIETTNKPSRESTRAKNQNPERSFDERTRLLLELKPTSEHRALADEGGLDVDWELGKFRDQALGAGKPPYDPVRAFSKWLKTGREKRIGRPPAAANGSVDGELERRARKLVESSTPLKRRQPDGDARLAWVPAIARLLGRGCDPVSIVSMIASGDADTLAEHGITVDDLGAIA